MANAPPASPITSGKDKRTVLAPLAVKAFFLQPRFLELEVNTVEDQSQTTSAQTGKNNGRSEVVVTSSGVPLGMGPRLVLNLKRSDALPPHVALELCLLKAGKEQWFDCQLQTRGDEQTLEIIFHTANRQVGATHTLELELRDTDELVEPARLVWHLAVLRPPLLEFNTVEARAVPGGVTQQSITLVNAGEGELKIEWIQVPGAFRSWLAIDSASAHGFTIPAGGSRPLPVGLTAKSLTPGEHRGHIEVACNHAGRSVVRSVPVIARVPTHAVRVDYNEADLEAVLTHGTASSFDIKVTNEAKDPVRLRVAAFDPLGKIGEDIWIGCDPERVNLTPGGSTTIAVHLSTAPFAAPPRGQNVQCEGALEIFVVEPSGETRIWNRNPKLQVQPRPKRFGIF